MLGGQQFLMQDHHEEADIDSADPSPRRKGSAPAQYAAVAVAVAVDQGSCEMQPVRIRVQEERNDGKVNESEPAFIQSSPKPLPGKESVRGARERRVKGDASRLSRPGSARSSQLTERLYNFSPVQRGVSEGISDGGGSGERSSGDRASDQASDREQAGDRNNRSDRSDRSDRSPSDREHSNGEHGSDREMMSRRGRASDSAPVFHWFTPKARHVSDSDEDMRARLNTPGELKVRIGGGANGLGLGLGLGGVVGGGIGFSGLGGAPGGGMEVKELEVSLTPLSPYRRWVRPWVRILFLLVVLWVQMVAGNVTTYFNNRKYAAQRRLGVIPRLDDVTNYFPHAELGDPTYEVLTHFVDWSYIGSLFAMAIALMASRSLVRLAEVAWVEMLMALCKSVFMLVTTLPDASGHQKGCIEPRFGEVGLWMVRRASTDFCGDMLFSGHTYHLLLGYIMTFRLVKDWDAKNQRHHSAFIMGVHLLAVVWCISVIASITVIRLHYTVDVLLSIVLTLLLLSHQPLLAVGVRFLYRPNPSPIVLPMGPAQSSESSLALTGQPQQSYSDTYKIKRDPPIILLKDNALA